MLRLKFIHTIYLLVLPVLLRSLVTNAKVNNKPHKYDKAVEFI